MSCGQLALDRANIKYNNYFASEIDKYAIKVTQTNYPNTIQLGTVKDWEHWNLPEFDLIMAGSPCQGFSNSGKGLNFNDPRSNLFFQFVNILRIFKPKYWLLENVKMKAEWRDIISKLLGVEPVLINSALVSAQNRERYYWANFPITQPKDKGIYLKDIIEYGEVDRDKALTLDANYFKGGSEKTLLDNYTRKSRRQIVKVEGAAIRGRYDENGKVVQRLERNYSPKANALTTVQKDSLACIQVGTADDLNGHDYLKRIYSPNGKAPAVLAKSGGNLEPKVAIDGTHYRKLTPIECERLQTVPDNYTAHVSNTQRYKMLGNGWTVDVIAGILKGIPNV